MEERCYFGVIYLSLGGGGLGVSWERWESTELGRWESGESSELGRWKRCARVVKWQGGKSGRVVR